jgi:hypothetical protein
MKNIFFKKHKKGGYAILFTVIVISAISVIAAGLSSSAYKQLILSSLARDSQLAFYQSDMATDCALYADWRVSSEVTPDPFKTDGGSWSCGKRDLTIYYEVRADGDYFYSLSPSEPTLNSSKGCFYIDVAKTHIPELPGEFYTKIKARGYNLCDLTSPRTVEREIEINY